MAVNGWFIFFGLLWAYIVFLFWVVRSGRLEKWNLSLMLGLVLMIRTKHGRKTLDNIAKPKRFWNFFGDFGTLLTLVGMVLMTAIMILTLFVVLDRESGVEPLAANEILVIPGVNPFVPLWYGIIALIVTLVVHEGGHGVLARANGLKVKSLGLLYAIVPIGAFVEPDEDELNAAPVHKRLRVFAAGATVNIVLAAVLMFAFGAMVAAAEPVDGVPVFRITPDSAAEEAGMATGDVIVSVAGVPTLTHAAFSDNMTAYDPGDQVDIGLRDGDVRKATLGNRWDDQLDQDGRDQILSLPADRNASLTPRQELARQTCDDLVGPDDYTDGGSCADALAMMAFLGVSFFPVEELQGQLADPLGNNGGNFLGLVSLPLGEVRGLPILSFFLPTFFEGDFDGYWVVTTLVFWVFWINLMVGLTNILPMLPLDGGHIFRDAVGAVVGKARPGMEKERRDRLVGRAAAVMSFVILGTFLLSILGPRLV